MGVPTRVVVYAETPSLARDAAAGAFARIAELEQVMSDYRPDSEAMLLCAQTPGVPHPISRDLQDILAVSQHLTEQTGGAFDATIGPATALWRTVRTTHQLPSDSDLATARALVGSRLLTFNPDARTATLARPGMRLDFGGIGKGYAAQAAVDWLRDRGHPRCLVALAGDIAAGDPPPRARGWVVLLPVPEGGGNGVGLRPPSTVILSNRAISTSGDTHQFIQLEGRRYAHIIDPRTGLGLTDCRIATVIATRGEVADALATAACVLGPEPIREVIAKFPGASVLFSP